MPELLLELGVEELPASAVERASRQLQEEICHRLTENHVTHGEAIRFATPRRLIVSVADVAAMQPDQTKEMRGPGVKGAYDADGNPTKALEGFCRGQGVELSDLRTEGDYVWATKTIAGKPTQELLAEILPAAIRALTWDKSMRWGTARMRFARPIRWLLAAFDGDPVSFQIESVHSGLNSRGHRFNAPDEFEARNIAQLLAALEARQVEPNPNRRRELILTGAKQAASGEPELTDALVDENVYLTEWPIALEGEFKEEFMTLPESVLITAMAKHERFLPIRGADGKLTNKFISIRNGGDEATVRSGNAWVLNARFNDAKFFFDEDSKSSLADFLVKTERMLFQEELGSVRKRADRLASLAKQIARHVGADEATSAMAHKAGLYAKADLSTGLVSELSSLQGVIGAEYAKREGFEPEVCEALATQYAPEKATGVVAKSVAAADQLDKLAGYLGLGLAPTGSSDPFGLRRAVTVLIDLALGWQELREGWKDLFEKALDGYSRELDRNKAHTALQEIFAGRYKAIMPEARYDLLDAAILENDENALLNPRGVRFRVEALSLASADVSLVQTFTRPLNIVAAARKKGVSVTSGTGPERLDGDPGTALHAAVEDAKAKVMEAVMTEDAAALRATLQGLVGPINGFFESTMVMAEDEAVRDARLGLLARVGNLLSHAGDWTKIVQEA